MGERVSPTQDQKKKKKKTKPVECIQNMEIRTTWSFKLTLAIQINLIQEQY